MTFKQFAFNNVKRNSRAYLSYFVSCVFAVTVFFMYAAVVFHPDIVETELQRIVQRGVFLSEFIIYGFSFLFVLYSTSAFIKSRKKEYGLLTTFGISKSQLNQMLILENTIIGCVAIIVGLLVGALLLKVFLMILSLVLGLDEILPFYISMEAIGLTAFLFFIMFEFNSIIVVWSLRTNAIMDVFRGTTKAKKEPNFSWILSILSLSTIGYAYYLAYTANMMSMMWRMFPILALIIPGTYFLFTQLSIACTNLLKRSKHYYYRYLNLLIISDFTYKLKDNARLLFFSAILSAVAFTSSGVIYGLFQSVITETERFIPQDVSIVSQSNVDKDEFQKEINRIKKEFRKANIDFTSAVINSVRTEAYTDTNNWKEAEQHTFFSFSNYRKLTEMSEQTSTFQPTPNTGYLLINDFLSQIRLETPKKLSFEFDHQLLDIKLKTANTNNNLFTSFPIIISDDLYNRLYERSSEDEIYYNYIMHIPNWINHKEKTKTILDSVDFEVAYPESKAEFYVNMKDSMSYSFFFGIFISVLFFLVAGSILYFRLYQNIDKDLDHFHSLYRLGLTESEMKKIITKQLGFLFFIPFFVAVIHASFAFKALQNMLASSILLPSIVVIMAYFIVHFINFIFIRKLYTAKLKKAM